MKSQYSMTRICFALLMVWACAISDVKAEHQKGFSLRGNSASRYLQDRTPSPTVSPENLTPSPTEETTTTTTTEETDPEETEAPTEEPTTVTEVPVPTEDIITDSPTISISEAPSDPPVDIGAFDLTASPTQGPTVETQGDEPTSTENNSPTAEPTAGPTAKPTTSPSVGSNGDDDDDVDGIKTQPPIQEITPPQEQDDPSQFQVTPTDAPVAAPTAPTDAPTQGPTNAPTPAPTDSPTISPVPTLAPTNPPTGAPIPENTLHVTNLRYAGSNVRRPTMGRTSSSNIFSF